MTASRPIDLVTFGESMGLFAADSVGALRAGAEASFSFGGAESNAAIAASRLGATTMWVSRLGADPVGAAIRRGLEDEGVQVAAEVDDRRPTGLMVKERLGPLRQRVSYWRRGSAASVMRGELVPDAVLASSRILLVSGITAALTEELAEDLEMLMVRARAAGASVAFDLNYRTALWPPPAAAACFARLAPLADIVFAGVDDARAAGLECRDATTTAAALHRAYGCAVAVATDGSDGAAALADSVASRAAAISVPVVDTVGAGDCFVGAFLAERAAERSVEECLATAVAAGAHACMAVGDWEGAPTRDDLEALRSGGAVER